MKNSIHFLGLLLLFARTRSNTREWTFHLCYSYFMSLTQRIMVPCRYCYVRDEKDTTLQWKMYSDPPVFGSRIFFQSQAVVVMVVFVTPPPPPQHTRMASGPDAKSALVCPRLLNVSMWLMQMEFEMDLGRVTRRWLEGGGVSVQVGRNLTSPFLPELLSVLQLFFNVSCFCPPFEEGKNCSRVFNLCDQLAHLFYACSRMVTMFLIVVCKPLSCWGLSAFVAKVFRFTMTYETTFLPSVPCFPPLVPPDGEGLRTG